MKTLYFQGLLVSVLYFWTSFINECEEKRSTEKLGLGGTLKITLFQALPMARDTFHYTRLLKASPSLALNASRHGASKVSQSNLFQCLTTPTVKNFFLTSNLNLSSFNFNPYPLVVLMYLHAPCKLQCLQALYPWDESRNGRCLFSPCVWQMWEGNRVCKSAASNVTLRSLFCSICRDPIQEWTTGVVQRVCSYPWLHAAMHGWLKKYGVWGRSG